MGKKMFPESKLAHRYLDGRVGIEIGASPYNPFGLNTENVDIADEANRSAYKKLSLHVSGEAAPIDVAALGDALPLPDASVDFVVSSHVLEHFPDPIKAFAEWYRVVKPEGYIYMIVSHRERLVTDRDKQPTTLAELLGRHDGNLSVTADPETGHCNYWVTEDMIELVRSIGFDWSLVDFQDTDDKVGNGFAIVLRKGVLTEEEKKRLEDKLVRLVESRAAPPTFFLPDSPIGRALTLVRAGYREVMRDGVLGAWKRIQEFTRKK